MSHSPLIVYGALRSGTTLLRLMLDGNKEMICSGEVDYLFDYLTISPHNDFTVDVEALYRDRIYNSSPININSSLNGADSIKDMIEQLAGPSDRRVVLMLHRGLDKAMMLYPDAMVLHVLRDPRDVARSSIGMGWAGTVFHGIEHWIATESQWDTINSEGKIRHCHELKYEDLINNTTNELIEICKFFEVAFDNNMLNYHEASSYDAPDQSFTEQWRRKQNSREIALVEGRLGQMLTDRCYEPSGLAPVIPTRWQLAGLWIFNKKSIWKNRIKKFGFFDPLLVAISQKIGIPKLGYNAQSRIDRKLVAYLK